MIALRDLRGAAASGGAELRALRLLVRLRQPAADSAPRERSIHVDTAYALREYAPVGDCRGAILLQPGLNQAGNQDPRLVSIARAFASLGYLVHSPNYEELRRHHLEPEAVEQYGAHLDSQLARLGAAGYRPGVVAPSYMGSVLLDAIARSPRRQRRVAALVTIGAFSRVEAFRDHSLWDPRSSRYGRLVLAKNLYARAQELTPALSFAIDQLLVRKDRAGPEDLLAGIEKSALSEADREALRRGCDQVALRERMARQGLELPRLALPESLRQLAVPLILLHGATDDLVTADHAAELFRHAPAKNTRRCITSLLSHGDLSLSLRSLKDLLALLSAFAFFFRALDQVPPSGRSAATQETP